MAKFGKGKIALFLACVSVFGGKNSLEAVNPGSVGGAVTYSKKMSSLTRGLTIGGLVLGASSLGYEVLGDTIIDKAPTFLKLIRGKNQEKTEKKPGDKTKKNFGPYYEQNWQKIKALNTDGNKESNDLIEACQKFVELTNEKEWLGMVIKIGYNSGRGYLSPEYLQADTGDFLKLNSKVKNQFKNQHENTVEKCINFLRGNSEITYGCNLNQDQLEIKLSN